MKILLQGDSITDWGRDRSDPHNMGGGYALFAAQAVREAHPQTELEFINLGISGNRTCDLVARWQTDCIDLQPDLVSILIGVNDTWRAFDRNDPTTAEQYEANYRTILEQTKAHTHAKIVMLEPFLLPNEPAKDAWRADLDPKIQAARRLAREFADAYLPLDGLFAAQCIDHEPAHWAADGVHPTEAGAKFIAAHYAACVAPFIR